MSTDLSGCLSDLQLVSPMLQSDVTSLGSSLHAVAFFSTVPTRPAGGLMTDEPRRHGTGQSSPDRDPLTDRHHTNRWIIPVPVRSDAPERKNVGQVQNVHCSTIRLFESFNGMIRWRQ